MTFTGLDVFCNFHRTGPAASALTVYFSASGTASYSDYQWLPGSVTFAAGLSDAQVLVTPQNDGKANDGTETVTVTITGVPNWYGYIPPTPYLISTTNTATVSISEDANSYPTISVTASSPTAVEPRAGQAASNDGVFTFHRTGPAAAALTVYYSVGGTAAASDYQSLPGSVAFAVGQADVLVAVTPFHDGPPTSGVETVIVTLTGVPSQGYGYTPPMPYLIDSSNNTATVSITSASDDSAVTAIGTPVAVDVLYNDSNYVGSPKIAIKPAYGSVAVVNGQIVYTPISGYVGSDSFTYSIVDAYGKMATATVSITVQLVVVRIEMNDTATHRDDVAFVGTALAVRVTLVAPGLPLPITVHFAVQTMAGGGQAVLSTNPRQSPGSGSNGVDLQMSNGQSAELYLTATQVSAITDDIQLVAFTGVENAQFAADTKKEVGKGTVDGIKMSVGTGTGANSVDRTGLIYNDSTPQLMLDGKQYRIPPRTWTKIWVEEAGALGADKKLYLNVFNQSDTHGRTELYKNLGSYIFTNPNGPIEITSNDFTTTISTAKYFYMFIRGRQAADGTAYQTAPGKDDAGKDNAGKLVLAVVNKATETDPNKGAASAGFSVSAIPIAVKMTFTEKLDGAKFLAGDEKTYNLEWGIRFKQEFVSDSGVSADLNKVVVSEELDSQQQNPDNAARRVVEKPKQTGFPYATDSAAAEDNHTAFPDFNFANDGTDQRPTAVQALKKLIDKLGTGRAKLFQWFTFTDERTGNNQPVVAASGFMVNFNFFKDEGKYWISVSKKPASAHGVTDGTLLNDAKSPGAFEIK